LKVGVDGGVENEVFSQGVSPCLDLPVCSGFVLHVKVGRREAGKSGKNFHPVSKMDTEKMPGLC
jgi:hypothetical protein